ncbi:mitochondrial genome maintenance MGM101-domain-containing protein, partial [Mycena floridula]
RPIGWQPAFRAFHIFKEITNILLAPIDPLDVEIKPDALVYLPEIKYRQILDNKAFRPGAWGLAPRGEASTENKVVSRECALVCQGRLVAIAKGEHQYFDVSSITTDMELCKSNALMRCCKDLGIASELWLFGMSILYGCINPCHAKGLTLLNQTT